MTENSSRVVSYPTEYMQQLAQTKQKKWDTDATSGRNKIKDNTLGLDDFGTLAAFEQFGQVYMAARSVYLETLAGVRQDLEAAAEGIVMSAKQMNDRDDQAGAAFLALRQRWENGLANEQNQTSASQTQQVQQADEARQTAAKQAVPSPAGQDKTSQPAAGTSPASSSTQSGGLSTPSIQ